MDDLLKFKKLEQDISEAMKTEGVKRMNVVSDLLDDFGQLNPSQLNSLLIRVYFAGREDGKEQLKKEISRL